MLISNIMPHYVKKNLDDIEIYDTLINLTDLDNYCKDYFILSSIYTVSNEFNFFSLYDKISELKAMCQSIVQKGEKIPAIQVIGESMLPHCLEFFYDLGCKDVFITDNNPDFLFKFGKICQLFKEGEGKDVNQMFKEYYSICIENTSYSNRTIETFVDEKDFSSKKCMFGDKWAFFNQYKFNEVCKVFKRMKIHLCLVNVFIERSCINFSQLLRDKECELFFANQSNVYDYYHCYINYVIKKYSITSRDVNPILNILGDSIFYNFRHFPFTKSRCMIRLSTIITLGSSKEYFYYTLNDFMNHFPRDIKYYIDNCENFIKDDVNVNCINYFAIYTQIIGVKMIPTSMDIRHIRSIVNEKIHRFYRPTLIYLCDLFDSIIAQTTDEERAREELKDLVPLYMDRISEKSIEEERGSINRDSFQVSTENTIITDNKFCIIS